MQRGTLKTADLVSGLNFFFQTTDHKLETSQQEQKSPPIVTD